MRKWARITQARRLDRGGGPSESTANPQAASLADYSRSGLGVSTGSGLFDHVIDRLAYLVFFQSMILDMAGNVGTQSLAVTIRVLADDVDGKTMAKLVFKEIRVGFFNGLIVGALSFASSALYLFIAKSTPQPLLAALCISAAMAVAMVVSSFFGRLSPCSSKNEDRSCRASGPLITTIKH
ncbi:MAG: magnesium transporter [Christensenellaceae bacterium]